MTDDQSSSFFTCPILIRVSGTSYSHFCMGIKEQRYRGICPVPLFISILLLLGYLADHTFDEPVEGEKLFVGHNLTVFYA